MRSAPGACLYLSWLLDPPADTSPDTSIFSTENVFAGSVIGAGEEPPPRWWLGKDNSDVPADVSAELSLLRSDESGTVKPTGASPIKRAQSNLPPTATAAFLAQPVGTFIRTAVSTTLPNIKTPAANDQEPAEEPPVAKVVTPIAEVPASGSSGGGGSNNSGGGPPAGGGRGSIQSRPSAAPSTTSSVNKTVAAPAVATKILIGTAASAAPSTPELGLAESTVVPPVTPAVEAADVPDPTLPESIFAAEPVSLPDAVSVAPFPVSSPSDSTSAHSAIVGPLIPAALEPSAAPASAPVLAQNFAAAAVAIPGPIITAADVEAFLDRASAATARDDAIIAVVDRGGRILGVRVEAGVPIALGSETMVFAIDGAVAKARTAAFFSSNAAPLTSRTVRFISQTTIAQREVESNPNEDDPTKLGPGFVAPIGLGGHFPPDVRFTPHVDLFAIEHTNRDSLTHPGEDAIRGTADDVPLGTRFGADFAYGVDIPAPESYGVAAGFMTTGQGRGIATLPGGIPLFKRDPDDMNKPKLVGGIGVFFPGPDGYATFEQNFQHAVDRAAAGKKPQTTNERLNAPLVKQAEYMAFAAAGGVGSIAGIPLPTGYVVPTGRIDLAGITLESVGPHPHGPKGLLAFGKKLGETLPGGTDVPVTSGGDLYIDGERVPEGWLVEPRDSGDGTLTADDVRKIIDDGVAEAKRVRAAIRLPLGSRTRMVLSVTDTHGEILGLFRMPDATFFSIDVAVAKARNVAYYADENALRPEDEIDGNGDGDADVPPGTALTNRTFRYLATPFFPTGVDTSASGPFSILNDPGINPRNAENLGPPLPADEYQSVLGYDAFNPGTNFRELADPDAVPGNQNGIVFFPGSTPLYKDGKLVGGLGVSGDGVDQDDVVTFGGAGKFLPRPNSDVLRADETFVRGVRLPYQKFSRNARA